jgi:alpha-1,2-mannosyltransferase
LTLEGKAVATSRETAMARAPETGVPPGRIATPRSVYAVIAVFTALAVLLRLFQLSRPGYLLGVTEYDDGTLFGNAVRLANGAIPYRDFVVVQPPGSIVLMAPVALLAKVTGTAWGLGIARLLTVGADSACVALLGMLVRHRGPLAAGVASGIYAVYPDALVASHTFLLEPWLNLFTLIGALLVFDGDQMAAGNRRLAWGGAALGFAMAVKLWAVIPLAIIGLLLARRPRRVAVLAAGAAAGLSIPVLPFLAAAPGRLLADTITSQAIKTDNRGLLPRLELLGRWPRLSDLAGMSMFSNLPARAGAFALLALAVAVLAGYMVVCVIVGRPPAPLDWYALIGTGAVILLFVWPQLYYPHYGAFGGPFFALALALPIGLLRPAQSGTHLAAAVGIGMTAAVLIAGAGLRQAGQMVQLEPLDAPSATAAADRLIPPGSCVVTNDASLTIAANRFVSNVAGCPLTVDSYGTFMAMTGGHIFHAKPQMVRSVVTAWQTWFAHADYIWLDPNGLKGQIPWTPALYSYFTTHFRLVGLASHHPSNGNGPDSGDVPRGGLYVRR